MIMLTSVGSLSKEESVATIGSILYNGARKATRFDAESSGTCMLTQ